MIKRFLTWEQKQESTKRAKIDKLCRWCGLDVHRESPKRRTFCSDKCVHEFNLRSSSSYIRHYITKRDNYKCQICGLDCKGFLRKLQRHCSQTIAENPVRALQTGFAEWRRLSEEAFFQLHGMEWVNTNGRSTFYDIDHIVAVVQNGGQCGEDNLRLVCLSCHRKETARLRAELKASKGK